MTILLENKQRLITLGESISSQWLETQLDLCIKKIEQNMLRFGEKFPSACGSNGHYRLKENDDWTNGFWTGMLWLSYEATQNESFLNLALKNMESFQERLACHFVLDHHDIGFLYSLSAGAGYKITKNEAYKKQLLQAADVLLARFQPNGQFIQAWGKYGEEKEYRLIIDSLINLPLLFEATRLSNNPIYAATAKKHYWTLLTTVIRENATTYHTYYFNPETGKPSHGATHQGNSDHSIWARGQSWAVLGIPLNESFLHSNPFPQNYPAIVDQFIEHLPADLVPYWDFDFTDEKPSAKDSSSLAIAACGLLEASKLDAYPDADAIAKGMIYQLGEHYSTKNNEANEGLLLHGVYAYAEGKGIDEPNLWGDYFYLEALTRLANKNWQRYW
ncbi:MAG: glycoside hydrolase family 88 protein [Carnobacterium sp.]|uniref:glycoside hydrolase family 88 protein n=1 Tax=Carnobacterium sp. TaxID=48221 RepID=UPI002958B727|nr:glycoside hydrolase family 88 protein [Carnobacterium sp.]MDV8934260.1 glycoside hydrolase family 88 protein [Carnobacterium sp.]